MLLPSLLSLSLSLPSGSAVQTPTDPDVQVRMLVNAIRRKKDDTIEKAFRDLGRIGTEKAFEGLQTCIEWLSEPEPLFQAYGSFREFKGHEALSRRAIEYLKDEALEDGRAVARAQAARALGKWSERAHSELELVARKGKDEDVRGHAVAAILPELFYRGDEDALRLILENVSPYDTYRLAGNLARFTSNPCRGIFKDLTLDKRNDPHLRALVIDHLVRLDGEDIDHVLAKLVTDREEPVQVAAIDGLKQRGKTKLARDQLWKLMSSRKLDVRLSAIQALGKLLVDDDKWIKRLYQLSVNRDPNSRMGAAYGLLELGDERAIEALYRLLEDQDWHVRVAALHNVEKVRTPRTIEVLIARLGAETGRLRVDVTRVLQRLTGMRLGANNARWIAWWKDHAAGYTLPDPEEERPADRRAVEGASTATFYGLPVYSDFTTFVMDVSGSMSQKTRGFEGDYTEGGRISRLAVARDQLKKLLSQMPDGHHCNVIFFSGELMPWSDEQEELDPNTRRDLNTFIDAVMPKGGTNIYDAIVLAMEDPKCDTIYILSDGQPTTGRIVQPDGIRRRVLQLNRRVNIQFYGISVGLISELFEALSEATGGRYVELGISAQESSSRAREILLRADATQEELQKALERARYATRIDPRNSQFRTALGIAAFRLGDLPQARKDLEAAAGLQGSGEARLKATRLAFLSRIQAREGHREQALQLFTEAQELLMDFQDAAINIFLDWARDEIGP